MGSIASQYTQKIGSISWAKVAVVIVSFAIAFGLMYGLFLLFSPPKNTTKNDIIEVVNESRLAPAKNNNIQPKLPTVNCRDTNLKDCNAPNLAPTLRTTTLRFDPNSMPVTVSITTLLQQNGTLVDVDQTLPLSVESLKALMPQSRFDATKLQLMIGLTASIVYETNQDAVFVNPGLGVRGTADFRLQIRDAKNAISNSAIITIAIDCAPNQLWNETKKRCETILTLDVFRQLPEKICAPTELVFSGTFSCDIGLVSNAVYIINNAITVSFAGQSITCSVIESEIIVPFVWRQSLHCPGISLALKLTRGYISESIALHVEGRKIPIKISGIIGDCPATTIQINSSEGTQCRCIDQSKTLDSETKTCNQTNRVTVLPQHDNEKNVELRRTVELEKQQPLPPICNKNQALDIFKNICKSCTLGQVSDGNSGCTSCPPHAIFEASRASCVACSKLEYPSVDGFTCIICDNQSNNGIPDCLSDCSFLPGTVDQPCHPCGTNYPSCDLNTPNQCDAVDTPFTRDNSTPQCPQIPVCDSISGNGVSDCEAFCDKTTCTIEPVCDTILDNAIADCPIVSLVNDLLNTQVDAVPFGPVLLTSQLPFVSVAVKNTPQNGVIISSERGISYIPLTVQDDTIEIILTNRAQQTRVYTVQVIASCPTGQSWNPTLKLCGTTVSPELLGMCDLVVISGVSACRFSITTLGISHVWTVPNSGLYTQFIDENNRSVYSAPCTIEFNQTPAAALLCLIQTQLSTVSDTLLLATQPPVTLSPAPTFICDTIPANQISDCQVYCNQIRGDFMPDCRSELCDFEFDNGIPDCPTPFATNQFWVFSNTSTPLQPSRPSDIFLTSTLLLIILYVLLFIFAGDGTKQKTSISSAPLSMVAVKKVIW